MKPFAAILGILALAACMAMASGPKITSARLDVTRTATTLWVKGYFTTTGNADAVVTNASVTGQTNPAPHTLPMPVKVDSFAFALPSAGSTVTVGFCMTPKRGAASGAQVCKTAPYTDSTPPGGTVDSLKSIPTSATIQQGAKVGLVMRVWRS